MYMYTYMYMYMCVCTLYVYVPMLARDDWAVIRVGNDARGPALSEMM